MAGRERRRGGGGLSSPLRLTNRLSPAAPLRFSGGTWSEAAPRREVQCLRGPGWCQRCVQQLPPNFTGLFRNCLHCAVPEQLFFGGEGGGVLKNKRNHSQQQNRRAGPKPTARSALRAPNRGKTASGRHCR